VPYRVKDRDGFRSPEIFPDVTGAMRTALRWRAESRVVLVEEISADGLQSKLFMTFGTKHTRSFSGFG
jgi:hypothetical protein